MGNSSTKIMPEKLITYSIKDNKNNKVIVKHFNQKKSFLRLCPYKSIDKHCTS